MPGYASKRGTRPRIAAAATAFALVLTALASLLGAAPALAEKRVALVIGNAAYRHAPALANPKNDAEGVAASLRRLKFDVLEGTDLDKPSMERLLQAFSLKLETADVALVFYAGHGLQVQGRNYLVPVEAKLDREADLVFQAVPLDVIQGLMEQSQRTNIMILDACRDNPLARNLARNMGTRSTSIGRGLGETKAGIGTLIVYATQPGNVALDGEGRNSPFTASLLKHIEAPGLEIRQVLTRVRNDVITATRDKQVPWDSSSLRGDFFFAAAPGATPAPPVPATPPATADTPQPRGPSADSEVVFWQSIKDSKNAADFKDYLQRWPSGTFAELAKRRIAEIEKTADVMPPPSPNPDRPTPQPMAPSAPQRSTTYQANAWINGPMIVLGEKGVPSAQACAAKCIRDLRCVAWMYWTEQRPGFPRECYTFSAVNERTTSSSHSIVGYIRMTQAAAPGPSPAPKKAEHAPAPKKAEPPAAATPVPQTGDALVRELVRKARAGESDNGFCAGISWPFVTDAAFYRFLDGNVVGAIYTYRDGSPTIQGYCRVAQIVVVGKAQAGPNVDANARCVTWQGYYCGHGRCGLYSPRLTVCRKSSGEYAICKCQ